MRRLLSTAIVAVYLLAVPATARHFVTETDDFNRADGSGLGANWTAQEGQIDILSNTAFWNTGTPFYFRNTQSWSNDQYSEITLKNSSMGALDYSAVTVRASGTAGSSNRYECMADGGGSDARLRKLVTGSYTNLDTDSVAFATNDVIRLEVTGTSLTCKKNGATILTGTDSDLASGSPGFGTPFNGGGHDSQWDDWSGGDLGGGGSPSFVPAIINAPVRGGGLDRALLFPPSSSVSIHSVRRR